MTLNTQQLEAVRENYVRLRGLLGGEEAVAENLAPLISALCPDANAAFVQDACVRMQYGAELMQKTYANYSGFDNTDLAERLLEDASEHMNEAERRGFYLQCFEMFRLHDTRTSESAAAVMSPDLAELGAEELCGLLSEQLLNTAESAMAESFSGESLFGDGDPLFLTDPLIMAAAEFAASVNGDIHEDYQKYPELLGANAAAQSVIEDAFGGGESSGFDIYEILFGISLILLGVALLLTVAGPVAAVVGKVGASLIALLGNGMLVSTLVTYLEIAFRFMQMFVFAAPVAVAVKGLVKILEQCGDRIEAFYNRLKERFTPMRAQYGQADRTYNYDDNEDRYEEEDHDFETTY